MDQVLRDAKLAHLSENFKAEKIEIETVLAMSDNDLKRVGVQTLGERVRSREACRRALDSHQPSAAAAVARERSHLFNVSRPRQSWSRGRKRNGIPKARTWTAQFVCLADTWASRVPTANEKQILARAGLGLKKIVLDLEDNEKQVTNKSTSDEKDERGQPKGFPQLKEGGGFEMLYCMSNSRDLEVLKCSRAARDVRFNVAGQSKIYLRPIQVNLFTKEQTVKTQSSIKEECKICNKLVPIAELRKHFTSCSDFRDYGESSSSDEDQQAAQSLHPSSQVLSSTSTTTRPSSANDHPAVPHVTVDLVDEDETSDNNHAIVPDSNDGESRSVDNIAKEAIEHCQKNGIENPLEILRYVQGVMVCGRALEVEDVGQCSEGDTNFIMVNRYDLIETAFPETDNLDDLRKTLEVQFYGEVCMPVKATPLVIT